MKTLQIVVIVWGALLYTSTACAEIVLLKSGEKLEGDIIISYNKGLLFREKEGATGRYYPYEEVNRVCTNDGKLYYLMPRKTKLKKKKFSLFPFATILIPSKKEIAPTPYITPPSGEAIEVGCVGAPDPVTIELKGGAKVRLLGLATPKEAGAKMSGKALSELSKRVKDKRALLFPGPQDPKDPGVAAAYIVIENDFLNAALLEDGWACVSPSPKRHPYKESFASLQRYAKSLHRGFWAKISD